MTSEPRQDRCFQKEDISTGIVLPITNLPLVPCRQNPDFVESLNASSPKKTGYKCSLEHFPAPPTTNDRKVNLLEATPRNLSFFLMKSDRQI